MRKVDTQLFEITVIDKRSYFEFICSAPHLLGQGWSQHGFQGYDSMAFPAGVTFLQGIATRVEIDRLILDDDVEIPFDFLVVATGL